MASLGALPVDVLAQILVNVFEMPKQSDFRPERRCQLDPLRRRHPAVIAGTLRLVNKSFCRETKYALEAFGTLFRMEFDEVCRAGTVILSGIEELCVKHDVLGDEWLSTTDPAYRSILRKRGWVLKREYENIRSSLLTIGKKRESALLRYGRITIIWLKLYGFERLEPRSKTPEYVMDEAESLWTGLATLFNPFRWEWGVYKWLIAAYRLLIWH
ncbi:MAG: hypothetical protein M1828_000472 [Chrysothrix sp. TS-e1954]|nr:MAG: hypothetical protein M1828_000472 [Chrysothrix sp. TS-e1954]